ncbi:MAG: DNA alkylation repair protein [Gammaproteobacteria bacterium]|nr:DNA alkylation repair protein [Gammaproteobacteria bacterium]
MAESERKSHKEWFDKTAATNLADQLSAADADFNKKKFVRLATRNLSKLEFSQRVQQFADAMRSELPEDIPQALDVIVRSLPPPLPDCESITDGYLQWPVGQFIADHGLPHLNESMRAMVELTQRFSSEYAVRPFVEHYPDAVFDQLMKLTAHESPHVRRWCSEGVRTRLPWGKKLTFLCEDPTPIWPVLDALRDDPELYVRRSVANNLNDITKDQPALVLKRCKRWARSGNPEVDWVIRHALRGLIKAGNPEALAAIGYREPRKLEVSLKIKPARVQIGGHVNLAIDLQSADARKQKLMIDFIVHYVRKNGSSSAKVFKWTTVELPTKGSIALQKRHSMKETTVRALYPGVHYVEVQVNGHKLAQGKFTLVT